MLRPVILLFLCLGVACSTPSSHRVTGSSEVLGVSLPRFPVSGVRYDDGITRDEAVILVKEYFQRFVGNCGIPDQPIDEGRYWGTQLWGGYAGSDYGRLRLAKDGSEVRLHAPDRGFRSVTRAAFARYGVSECCDPAWPNPGTRGNSSAPTRSDR